MNILTVSHSYTLFKFRSDSTMTRCQESYYLPDYVKSISFTPIVYYRCSRPGKAVEERFAHRYIDSFGYGILLHPHLSDDIIFNRDFIESALDFTSIIPLETHPISDYGSFPSFKHLKLTVNGHIRLENPPHPSYDHIRQMIAGITRFAATRTGDIIGYELTDPIAAGKGEKIRLLIGEKLLTEVTIF